MDQPERRRGVRTSPKGNDKAGWVEMDGRRIPVLIADEAVGGIGIVAVHWPRIHIGATVTFFSNSRNTEGRVASVRHVTLAGTPIFRIGLAWMD